MNKKNIVPYLFLAPFFIIFIIFIIYPILNSFYLSFTETKGMQNIFIGLENYKSVLTDIIFWKSLLNVFIVLLVQVPVMLLLATVFATLLNSDGIRFKGLFRLCIFLPVLIDLVTYSIVFSLLFNEQFGMINYFLGVLGFSPVAWTTHELGARLLIIFAVTWRWTGYNTIIILAGLQSIDNGLYEVADIEGASSFVKLFRITIPLLKPILLFCAIMSTIGTVQLFTEPMLLTNGGPDNSTITPIMYLFQYGFQAFKFGYASAVAYIITIIVFVMSLIQIKITKGVD